MILHMAKIERKNFISISISRKEFHEKFYERELANAILFYKPRRYILAERFRHRGVNQ